MLRTNLQFTTPDKPLKTLLITSAGPEEGKSTVTANLAVSMAQANKRVIAVNVDLRRPTMHRYFGVPNHVGLTSVLVGQASLEDALQETNIPGVQVLVSGPTPPNPAELLGSKRMQEIIASLGDMADIVLFDAPPLIAVTDPGLLASRMDGCLLVVGARTTPREAGLTAKEHLNKVGARIVGVVLNRVQRGSGYYYHYYYTDDTEREPLSWWDKLLGRLPFGSGGAADRAKR